MPPIPLASTIFTWEHDPGLGAQVSGGPMIEVTAPDTLPATFQTEIKAVPIPDPMKYSPGTAEFRYWVAAEALHRASKYWSDLLPSENWYHWTILPVLLEAGLGFNANYNRSSLRFYKGNAGTTTIFSGESPDVVCHEHGHAILDAIKPQLWDVASVEADAFHESFGDMSAILCALQLQSMRESVLKETAGKLYTSSRLSRIAEQLAFAIRLKSPMSVESDCLRNAVNAFEYVDPRSLPTTAPASSLSTESHSFSRVFTSAFFEGLARMFELHHQRDEKTLQIVSTHMGQILAKAIRSSDIVPRYFVEIALKMIAEADDFAMGYEVVLKDVFTKHGFLFPGDAAQIDKAINLFKANRNSRDIVEDNPIDPQRITLLVDGYGFETDRIEVYAPGEADTPFSFLTNRNFRSHSIVGDEQSSPNSAAKLFFDNLIRRSRLKITNEQRRNSSSFTNEKANDDHDYERHTHELLRDGDKYMLRRIRIECGHH